MASTFDIEQVKQYAADVNAKLDRCEHGEGLECHSLDSTLTFCAQQCCEFARNLRKWGSDVFSGRIIFDPAAEQFWKAELAALYARAVRLYYVGVKKEEMCFSLDGSTRLKSALWELSNLLNDWVTPRLAVAPSARRSLDDSAAQQARQKIGELTPLPKNWAPDDQRQADSFQKRLRKRA